MDKRRYIRQTTLNEVGEIGQQKLLKAKVLVVGCGGLGNYVAVNLAASGIGNIYLLDFDSVDISNLHRQVFYKTEDIGKSKSETLAKYINTINKDINIDFRNAKLLKNELRAFIRNFDYVLECTDDLESKYMLNDACVLENKTLIYASLHKFEAHVATFNTNALLDKRTANLRDVFAELPKENIPTCSEVGTLNPIVGLAAMLQVNEVLKLVLEIGKPLVNQLLVYNSLDNSQLKIKLKVNEKLNFKEIWENSNYGENQACDLLNPNEIDEVEFRTILRTKSAKIISVLENETDLFEADFYFPFSCFVVSEIDLEKADYVIVCQKGNMSMASLMMLNEKYPDYSFKSLYGGIESLK